MVPRSMSRHDPQRASPSPTSWLAILLALLLLPATPQVLAQGSQDTSAAQPPLFVHAKPTDAIEHDPWADAVWIGVDRGGALQVPAEGGPRDLLTLEDGLPSNYVLSLAPDAGRVWIGTSSGLASWDRSSGEIETHDRTQAGDRLRTAVHVLHLEDETLWIGTDQGLYKLGSGQERLTAVQNPVNGSEFEHPIRGIDTDGHELWISATGYGVVEWDRDTGDSKRHDNAFTLITDKPYVGDIGILGEDVWIGTGGEGARRYNRTTEKWVAYANPDNLAAYHVADLEVTSGEVWFAVETGIARYDVDDDRWQHWNAENGFPGYRSEALSLGGGQIWADSPEGVVTYDRLHGEWRPAGLGELTNSPPFTTITDCRADGDEIIFSTGGAGAATYDPTEGTWEHTYPIGTYGEDGMPDVLVHGVETTEDGLWFATVKGVGHLDRASGEWAHLRTDNITPPDGVRARDEVLDLDAGLGTVWVASTERGLGRYDASRDDLVMLNATDGLSSDRVLSVETHHDRVWVGTDQGLDVYDPSTGEVTHVYPSDGGTEPIATLHATKDALWVGSAASGLVHMNTTTHEATVVAGDGEGVREILVSGDTMWAATFDGSILELPSTGDGSVANRHTLLETSPPLEIMCLLRVGDVLYVGTTWGVHRLDTNEGTWLPQAGTAVDPSPPELGISAPEKGQTFRVGDEVQVHADLANMTTATVEARLGTGPWQPLTLADGSVVGNLSTQGTVPGNTSLVVRALDGEDRVARGLVPIEIQPAANATAAPDVHHDPPLEVYTEERIKLRLKVDPPETNATPTAVFQGELGDKTFKEVNPGVYELTLGPFEEPLETSYAIRVGYPGGQLILPEPGGSFGEAYPLAIRENPGFLSLHLPSEPVHVALEPGQSQRFQVAIQNTGTRTANLSVEAAGPAASWISEVPAAYEMSASSTWHLTGTLTVPPGTEAGLSVANLTITPAFDRGDTYTLPLVVDVTPPGASDTDENAEPTVGATNSTVGDDDQAGDDLPIPSLPFSGLLATIAVVAWSRVALTGRGRE